MVDCSADVSFQCSVLREGGGLDLLPLPFFPSALHPPLYLRQNVCSPPLPALSLSAFPLRWARLYVTHRQPSGRNTGVILNSLNPYWKKNVRAASALRGHRGSCQRPVSSRTALHGPIMYCQQGGCTKHFNRTKIFLFALSFLLMNEFHFNSLLPPKTTSQAFDIR